MLAFVFPGQGSQLKGMVKDVFDNLPSYRQMEADIDKIAGFSVRDTCLSGSEDTLRRTEITQTCMLVVNALFHQKAIAAGAKPAFLAGHSLGEYNALVAAGALTLLEALALVRERGR